MDCGFLIGNLEKRGFIPKYFENIDQANAFLLTIIPKDSVVGFGGSVTVIEMGIPTLLKNHGSNVLFRGFCESAIEKEEVLKNTHNADFFICSTNALCESGDLVNIDGRANRVAEMLYGPKNVIVVCGTNKIVENIEKGIDRTRNVAAPKNSVKLNKKTPCAVTGTCNYCNSPDTICKATVIQHHPTTGKTVYIIIVNQNLGF